jgi:hypothetical protein
MNFPVGIPCVQTNPQEKNSKDCNHVNQTTFVGKISKDPFHLNYWLLHHIQGWSVIGTPYMPTMWLFLWPLSKRICTTSWELFNALVTSYGYAQTCIRALKFQLDVVASTLLTSSIACPLYAPPFLFSISGCHYLSHNSKWGICNISRTSMGISSHGRGRALPHTTVGCFLVDSHPKQYITSLINPLVCFIT